MFKLIIKLTVATMLVLYVGAPIVVYYFPQLMSRIVFLSLIYCPYHNNLSDYQHYSLHENNTITLHVLNEESQLELGIWYIVPPAMEISQKEMASSLPLNEQFMKRLSSSTRDIIFYMHGNALNRGSRTARRMYPRLRNIGVEIITMDYRGYGDSEGVPMTEAEVVSDALSIYRFIRQHRPLSRVFLWGHSLGTGVASSLVSELQLISDPSLALPSGVVLETPFVSIRDAGASHPHGRLHRMFPILFDLLLDGFARAGIYFENYENLLLSEYPILILHPEDDNIVPIEQGRKLYAKLQAAGKSVSMHEFPASLQYRHTGVSRAPELEQIISGFINMTTKQMT